MSRIGKIPINIPDGVTVTVNSNRIAVEGTKGKLDIVIPEGVVIKIEDKKIKVESKNSDMQGMVRAMAANAIMGVTQTWKKTLELSGTGFRAAVVGDSLQLALGFSHPVNITAPFGIAFEVKENKITVSGYDKGAVGQMAAVIRGWRPADPYKAKGLKYEDEVIIKKAGKAAKAGGAAGAK